MEIVSRELAMGDKVELKRTNKSHFNDEGVISRKTEDPEKSFARVFFNAVNEANSLQHQADELEEKMILYPDEVNIHDVMIASEKARLSVSLLKTVVEKAVRAYNEIVTMR
ncbi:MAG: flagellar hook-basal body complex protein FliE [Brevinematia bacterium]